MFIPGSGPGSGRMYGELIRKVAANDTRENRDELVEFCVRLYEAWLRLRREAAERAETSFREDIEYAATKQAEARRDEGVCNT